MPKGSDSMIKLIRWIKINQCNGGGGVTVWSPSLDLIVLSGWIDMQNQFYHHANSRFAVTLRNAILEHWRVESPHWVFMVCPGPAI